MVPQFSLLSAEPAPLEERSSPGVLAEGTGETEQLDLGPSPTPRIGTRVPATFILGTESGKEVIPKEKRGIVIRLVSLITGEAQFLHGVPSVSQPSRFTRLHYNPNILLFFALEIVDRTFPVQLKHCKSYTGKINKTLASCEMENIKVWPVTKHSFHWSDFMSMNRSVDTGFSLGSVDCRT